MRIWFVCLFFFFSCNIYVLAHSNSTLEKLSLSILHSHVMSATIFDLLIMCTPLSSSRSSVKPVKGWFVCPLWETSPNWENTGSKKDRANKNKQTNKQTNHILIHPPFLLLPLITVYSSSRFLIPQPNYLAMMSIRAAAVITTITVIITKIADQHHHHHHHLQLRRFAIAVPIMLLAYHKR